MIWTIDIELVTKWYWIAIGLIALVSIYGTWKHKTSIPVLWGALMCFILYYGATILEPIIFGYEYYAMYSFQWVLVGAFGIMFAIINGIYLFNVAIYGTVVE